MGLPNIDIAFKQLAVSAIARSTRGKVALIIADDTVKTFTTKTYKLATDADLDKLLYTAINLQYIKDCFMGIPLSVTVIRIDKTAGVMADALAIAAKLTFDWIGIAEGIAADQLTLTTWIKAQEALKKTYKAVVYNPTTPPDCKHVVNFTNSNVIFADTRAEVTGEKYVASLLGIFAGISLDKSTTYYVCGNLINATEPVDVNAAINLGNLVLINDVDKVRIGSGVNSLSTIDTVNTEDMKQVVIVESMDLMLNDIRTTFKESYVGKYKNKYDNQILLISAINSYFKALANVDILDAAYTNIINVDVEAQRQAWLVAGKTEATTWTDAQVKNNTFKNNVMLAANVKILGAIENLKLNISMA